MLPRIAAIALALTVGLPLAGVAEEPEELVKARKTYREKIEKLTAPVTKSYIKHLEAMKRKLGAKGEIEQALAVQQEIDSVSAALPPPSGDKAIVGTWRADGNPEQVVTFYADGRCKATWFGAKNWKHLQDDNFVLNADPPLRIEIKLSIDRKGIVWRSPSGRTATFNRIETPK